MWFWVLFFLGGGGGTQLTCSGLERFKFRAKPALVFGRGCLGFIVVSPRA